MHGIPDAAPIVDLIEAFRSSKAMFVAVSLGVFDHLAKEPADLSTLAGALACTADPLERLLDACVGLNLLSKDNGHYTNTALASAYLCYESPHSLAGYILYSDQVSFRLWAHLEDAIRSGGPRWKEVYKEDADIFDQFFRTDDAMRHFLKGMHGFGMLTSMLVVSAFDLSAYRQFVDVGGATGHLAMAALERYPRMRATLFDQTRVIDSVQETALESPFAARLELAKGNFFDGESIPAGDVYGLGRILHDWPDEKVVVILRGIHDRLPSGGGVLLAEKLLKEDKSGPLSAHLQSLNMLVCAEGKERTLSEFRALLESCGFGHVEGRVTGAPLDAVFAQKL
jgi:acetylserotonin N-methyltransferase